MSTHYGLTMNVYRCADGMDATANGITSTHTRLTLIGTIDQDRTFTPSPQHSRLRPATDNALAVALREHAGMAHLVPVDADGAPVGVSCRVAGGNYVTGGSRVGGYSAQRSCPNSWTGLIPTYTWAQRASSRRSPFARR